MDEIEAIDRNFQLHGFAPVAEDQPSTHIAERAEGMKTDDNIGRAYLDTLSGLWCVHDGYGKQFDRFAEALTRVINFH